MALKKPQIVKVKTDIQSLTIYLRSVKKFGKSTLFRDLILEKYGDAEKGLLVGLGAEVGYSILDNLNATQIENWEDLIDLKEWLIEEKGKEHDIQMIAFDVVDELIPIAENEVIAMSRRDGKPTKTFNGAYGGYGEPRKKLNEIIKEFFVDLRKAGFGIFAISHTKVKTIKEKGDDSEGYNLLSSNLSNDNEALFGDIFDCVLTGYIDRSLDGKKITNEERRLYLRGNGFVEAGCRFKDGTVPEYIVFDKPDMAKDFIEVLEEGMRLSKTNPTSKEEFKIEQKQEVEKIQKSEPPKPKQESIESKQERLDKIKANMSKIDMLGLQKVMNDYKLTKFEAETISTEALDELEKLIK